MIADSRITPSPSHPRRIKPVQDSSHSGLARIHEVMYSELSKQQLLGRMFSNAGVYGIGIILTRLGALVLLPVYWLKLEPADFGIIGLAQVITIFLGPLLSLGLYDGIQRMYFEWNAEERPYYLAALWVTSLGLSLAVCLGLYWFGAPMFAAVLSQVPFAPYVQIAIWTAFTVNLGLFPLTLLRMREELRRFSLVTVSSFVSQAILILVFVFVLEMKALGYLLGILTNGILWSGYFVYFMTREIRFPFRLVNLVDPLRYSLPTVPASVLDGVGSVLDRVFLDKFVSLGVIGLYNLGNQFGSALNAFNQIMKSSWVPLIFRVVSDRSDGPEILGRFSLYYITVMAVPALIIALLSQELIEWFGNERYAGIYPFVPFFVLTYYLQAVGTAMGRGIDLAKKTIYSPVVAIVTLVASLVGMWLLAPRYGVWGVVVAFLVATVFRIGTHIGLALYFYPRPIFFWRLLSLFLVMGLTFLAGLQINTGSLMADAGLKVVTIVAGMLTAIWTTLDGERALLLFRRRFRKLQETG